VIEETEKVSLICLAVM